MKKKIAVIITIILIMLLLTNKNVIHRTGFIDKVYASENTKFYGDYGIDGNYIKYIKDNTTVTYFAETSKLGENVKVKDKNNQERSGKDLVRTGDHIEIQDEKYTAVVAGDVDGNGVCNVIDFIAINGHRLGKNRLKDEYIIAGDVNYDGSVNILDMIKTNGYRLKKVDKLVPDIIQVEEIETDNKEIKITEGEEVSIHATAKPDNAQHKHLEYKSSDETIAEVDQNGRIKSKKAGKCVITIEAENGVSVICNVEIEKKKIPVQTIELSSEEIELKAGESELISATIKPKNATNKEIEWTSSNYEIATVDSKGEITGKQTGEATIIAKAKDGGEAEGQVKVKVYTKVEKIELSEKNITIEKGQSKKIEGKAIPENAINTKLYWSSENEEIADVNDNGEIRGKKVGETKIIVTTEDGIKEECTVKVEGQEDIQIKEIQINSNDIEINKNQEKQLAITISPSNATNKEIQWISKNEKIVEVDLSGMIRGKKAGETEIIARTTDGSNLESTIKVKVVVAVTALEVIPKNIEIKTGEEEQAYIVVTPTDASNKVVEWKSTNENIARISAEGKITGVGVGEAEIIAKTTDGSNIEGRATVKVEEEQKEILVSNIIANSNINLEKGERKTASLKILPDNATNKGITWESDNEEVATVDANGTVEGKGNGETTITVKAIDGSNVTAKIKVKVVVPVEKIKINKDQITLDMSGAKETQIIGTIEPEDATDKSIEWESSNTSVVRVDETGKVTGIGNGSATITASSANGKTATCTINVVTSPTRISLNKTTSKLDLSGTKTVLLTSTIAPSNANINKEITWKSSNTAVATVDETGKVTGIANGTANITATLPNGTSATCTVTVVTSPTEISLSKNSVIFDMSNTKTTQLKATITPNSANANKGITWTSSNTNVVNVSTSGYLTAVGNGEATITASSANGKTATCTVKVQTSATSVTLNKTTLTLDIGGTKNATLVGTIGPETADINKEITWTSGNTKIATVDETGKVTAIANGTVNIIATLPNEASATCTVTVVTSPTGISLSKNSDTLDMSGTKSTQLKATITPNSANANKGITWTSSNTNVVNVSTSGYLTAVGNGEAKITAKTANGKTATCTVKVQTSATSVTLNKTTLTLETGGSKTATLTGTITPKTANINNTITWKSENTKIATVENTGKVTAIANGTANITATLPNGATATCTVKVQTSPTAITLNKTTATLDMSGTKTVTLKETINPNTVNANKTITWTSSNTKVATVTSSGKVTGVANGVTTITASTGNGKKATCKITVQTSPTEIYFSANKNDTTKYETIQKGKTKTFKPEIKPNTANVNNSITYSLSGNSKIASIDSKTGKITAKQAGIVTLTAKSSNGKTAKMKIWVKIGNKAVNTTALTSISGDSIYSLAVPAYKAGSDFMHMQSFDIDSKGAIYYAGNNNKDGRGYKTHIYKATGKNARPTETGIEMIYSGHQSSIDVEEEGDTRYIWNMTFGSYIGKYGTAGNYAVSRIKYQNNKRIYWGPGTVTEKNSKKQVLNTYQNMAGDNFVYMNDQGQLRKSLCASVDEENGLLCIYYKNSTHVFFYIYDLNEALKLKNEKYTNLPIEPYKNVEKSAETTNEYIDFTAKNLGYKKQEDGTYVQNITPLATLKIENFLTDSMQGFDLDGDYIYVIEGLTKPTNITAFDYMYNYNGNKPLFKGTTVTASHTKSFYEKMGTSALLSYNNKNFYETEGIKVKNGVVYCGYAAKYDGETRASILQVK